MFAFFTAWLMVVGCAMAVAGTLLVFLAGTPLFAVAGRLLERPFWTSKPDDTTRQFQVWAYSVTFATMAGWGTAVAFVAANAFASRQSWAWLAIAASLAIWYPLDTGRSLYHRVYANALLNTALLILVGIPLALTFGEFLW